MAARTLLVALAVLGTAQPSLAADPGAAIQGAVMSGQSVSSSAPSGNARNGFIEATAFAGSLGAGMDMAAASHKSKHVQRHVAVEASAELALLAGAGMLTFGLDRSALPNCGEEERDPLFHCQVIKKLQKSR